MYNNENNHVVDHTSNQGVDQNSKVVKQSKMKWLAIGISVVLLIGTGAKLAHRYFYYVETDDAYVEGHVVAISPKVSSHVQKVWVNDNQMVKAGDLLLELDSNDFVVQAAKAKANLEAAKMDEEQAKRDVERYAILVKREEISKQQFDMAKLRVQIASAQKAAAEATLKQADLSVSYTKIYAPVAGHVTKKSVEEGAFVLAGQPLLAIVPDDMWIVANFKETQLGEIHPGQKAVIKVDTYPDKEFQGHVDSIQSGTGSKFSMFPPENAAGNFVKVVQRVPVKIVLDGAPDAQYPLRVGMSVDPIIRVHE